MPTADDFLLALIAAPRDQTRAVIFSDWLEERGEMQQATALRQGRIRVDGATGGAMIALSQCRFAPATFDKRFVRQVCNHHAYLLPDASLTLPQWALIWRLAWKYRGQIAALRLLEVDIKAVVARAYFFRPAWYAEPSPPNRLAFPPLPTHNDGN
jgi:uncharacterized protein (TIGR02996 family)